jgi:hypothetical protein
MNSYEHCTEIEWREKKNEMDIALKKKPVQRFFLWNDHGSNSIV